MKKIGVVFRKYNRSSIEQMRVQTFKLIAAVTKKSNSVEVIHYNVEKDPGKHLEYHSHFVIEGACLGQLKKESQRVLKTSNWIRDYSVDSTFYSHVEVLKSVYGEVRIHACPNISGFLDYMSGNTKQKTVGYYYYLPKALKEKIDKELPASFHCNL